MRYGGDYVFVECEVEIDRVLERMSRKQLIAILEDYFELEELLEYVKEQNEEIAKEWARKRLGAEEVNE